jgi:pimeloyl-ACP methyl ester carboxylesterase
MSTLSKPRIRFFTGTLGQRIAYATAGQGPTLVLPAWWVSHVERDVADERFRRFFERLAAHFTVVRYDRPGVGLSERERSEWTLQSELGQLEALIDHLGVEQTGLLGFSCGGPAAVAYAARHPDRVTRLILVGAYANGQDLAEKPVQEAIANLARASWGMGAKALSDLMAPDLSKAEVREQAKSQLASCSPEVAGRLLQMTFDLDCSEAAANLGLPTLVLHRRNDQTVRLENGRELAALIPDADFQVLEGDAHVPWQGDQDEIIDPILEFMGATVEGPETTRATGLIDGDDAACLWRREGELWRLRFDAKEVVIPHRKGLEDLAVLLANPMRAVSAAELRDGPSAEPPRSERGADAVLDAKARSQYAERLNALDSEFEPAQAANDLARTTRLGEERETLLDELRTATGLGGRERMLGDPAEKARKAVSARIRDAIKRLRDVHPGLADHLDASVTTGLACVYRPDSPPLWHS